MAVSIGRGVSTLASPRFYKMVAFVLGGAVFSTVAVDYVQENVFDAGVPFQDVVYSALMVLVVRSVMSGRSSMLLAAGAGTGMVVSTIDEMGVL